MTINKTQNGQELILAIEGRLDTMTSPELDAVIAEIEGIDSLVLDIEKLEYISSAGLRVILAAQKKMNKQGSMVVKNVCETVMEVFDMTGFVDILTIE